MKTEVEEYIDNDGEHRIRVIAKENGQIIDSTHQGYTNKKQMIKSKVRAAKAILEKYKKLVLVLAIALTFVGCEKEEMCSCGTITQKGDNKELVNNCSGNSLPPSTGFDANDYGVGELVCLFNPGW